MEVRQCTFRDSHSRYSSRYPLWRYSLRPHSRKPAITSREKTEREGFEPSVGGEPYTGLAILRLRPCSATSPCRSTRAWVSAKVADFKVILAGGTRRLTAATSLKSR